MPSTFRPGPEFFTAPTLADRVTELPLLLLCGLGVTEITTSTSGGWVQDGTNFATTRTQRLSS
jgi:hypothetical protein